IRPSGERWTVANDEASVAVLPRRLRRHAPALVVLEATGGYERAAVAALAGARLPLVVANPRQVRDFARATGQLAKTDRIDADMLALFAERVCPEPRTLPDETAQALDGLLTRRRQILGMLVAERNRLEHAVAAVRHGILQHIRWLERQLHDVDQDLDRHIHASPVWRATATSTRVPCGARRKTFCGRSPGSAPSSVVRSSATCPNSAPSRANRLPRSSVSRRWPATAGRSKASAWSGAAAPLFALRCTWPRWWPPGATQ